MNEIVLKLEGDKVYPDKSFSLSTATLGFTKSTSIFKPGTYWKVRIHNFYEKDKRLAISKINFHATQYEFENQPKCLYDIEKFSFMSLDTAKLLKCTERISEPALVITPPPQIKSNTRKLPRYEHKKEDIFSPPETIKKKIHSEINVAIDDLIFGSNEVRFKTKEIGIDTEIKLVQTSIRPQFSSVTGLIKKIVGKDRIAVKVSYEVTKFTDGHIINKRILNAESPDLEKFTCKEIELELECKRVDKNITALCESQFDTATEISSFDDIYKKLNTDSITPSQALKKTIERSKIHFLHLQYLSSIHLFEKCKLLIQEKPFSFIFLLESPSQYHFVLEVHSEKLATYVWHFEKNRSAMKKKYYEIKPIIKSFEEPNRKNYLRTKPQEFSRIPHEYSGDDSGFKRWKSKLHKVLAV